MINCEKLYKIFEKHGFKFFTGVPDSTFEDWMRFLADNHGKLLTNVIAHNEGGAAAIASGYYLATGEIGVVYMQNSGLGNVVNPQTSLSDKEVYSIPILYLIGWRGEPGKKDEPQHKKMGRIMIPLLDVLEIPYKVLPIDSEGIEKAISEAKKYMDNEKSAYALVIKKETLEEYKGKKEIQEYEMTRESAIKAIVESMDENSVIISTTGKTSRELFEFREERKEGHEKDFLTVGSMGHSASIALGVAMQRPEKKVFVFDGDGAVIMHEGVLSTIGYYSPKNLYHIVFDNESYDSTGEQPTVSKTVNFEKLALANNYKAAKVVNTKINLENAVKEIKKQEGPQMLVVKVKKGARKDLGRPTTTPIENKEAFTGFIQK